MESFFKGKSYPNWAPKTYHGLIYILIRRTGPVLEWGDWGNGNPIVTCSLSFQAEVPLPTSSLLQFPGLQNRSNGTYPLKGGRRRRNPTMLYTMPGLNGLSEITTALLNENIPDLPERITKGKRGCLKSQANDGYQWVLCLVETWAIALLLDSLVQPLLGYTGHSMSGSLIKSPL